MINLVAFFLRLLGKNVNTELLSAEVTRLQRLVEKRNESRRQMAHQHSLRTQIAELHKELGIEG
jgi:hypothetical protein